MPRKEKYKVKTEPTGHPKWLEEMDNRNQRDLELWQSSQNAAAEGKPMAKCSFPKKKARSSYKHDAAVVGLLRGHSKCFDSSATDAQEKLVQPHAKQRKLNN